MYNPAFIRLLTEAVGEENGRIVLDALGSSPSVSIRLNPSKLDACPFAGAKPVPWSPFGWLLPERPSFTSDPLFHAGCYYVQDSSAMFVGELLRRVLPQLQPGGKMLDECAAPGGKTTDAAASLRERFGECFTLLANEVMRNRYAVLRGNIRSWGDPRVGVTNLDPAVFGRESDAAVAFKGFH